MQIHFTTREAELLHAVAKAAAVLDIPAFAVGGFVRDKILNRPTKDIDIVCMGDGMELAQAFAKLFKPMPPVSLFKTFGTAQVKFQTGNPLTHRVSYLRVALKLKKIKRDYAKRKQEENKKKLLELLTQLEKQLTLYNK